MLKVLAENELKRLLRGSKYFIVGKAGGRAEPPRSQRVGGGGGSQIAVTEDEHLITNYCNISIFYQDFLLFFP